MSFSVLTNAGKGIVSRPREEFVVHFPHYDKDSIGPASAIYLGDFKLIRIYETGRLELFDHSLPDLFCDTIPAVHTLLKLDWTARHEGSPVQVSRYKAKLAADFRPTMKANFEWTM